MAVFRHCCWNRSTSRCCIASALRRRAHRDLSQSIQADVIAPDRILAEAGDELAMCGSLLVRQSYGERNRAFPHHNCLTDNMNRRRGLRQDELRLARADQFDIDLGKKL